MAKKVRKPKNIIICCDGTGNEPSAGGSSNVFDLVGLLQADKSQLVYYDPGLGTESAPGAQTWVSKTTSKVAGMAFGYGLSQNIKDAYKFLMNNYLPGDQIYMFGFSRGAYTVRTIAGMLELIGILRPGSDNLLDYALASYVTKGKIKWDDRGVFKSTLCQKINDRSPYYQVPIRFMGIWDTVKSVGILRDSSRLAHTDNLPNVKFLRHAVALDEKRSKFRPDHVTCVGGVDGSVQTMWFRGVHSDIGGGYKGTERGLSDHTMAWMIEGTTATELGIDVDKLSSRIEDRKKDAVKEAGGNLAQADFNYYQAHNSLEPIWWIAGWRKRKLPNRFWIHKTAVQHLTKDGVSASFNPVKLIADLGTNLVHLSSDVVLLNIDGNLAFQKLTKQELSLLNTLDQDPIAAQQTILSASVQAWAAQLDAELLASHLHLGSQTTEKKAKTLLADALIDVQSGLYKGKSSALAKITKFLRMTSLSNDMGEQEIKLRIINTAPYLLETLAEALPIAPDIKIDATI